jgi:ABC-2 type transport system permease protein
MAMPIVMIILFGFALSTEVRNVNVAILLPEPDNTSRQIIERLDASKYFTVRGCIQKPENIDEVFRSGKIDIVIAFGQNFSKNIISPEGSQLQIIVNASDANMAQSYATYTRAVITQHLSEAISQNYSGVFPNVLLLHNPQMKSSYNFVPGIMGLIFMLICAMMTSIAIVKEKETGTMEVLLVSPMHPTYIIFAKMIPYFTISCINLATILLLSVFILEVPVAGSIIALISVSLIYIFTTLALGLLISTVAKQQIIAMLFSAMLLMVPTILLSGLVFPIESMPKILQLISCILPPRWYISAIRKLMIEGLPIIYASKEIIILSIMSIIIITISLLKFKKRLE